MLETIKAVIKSAIIYGRDYRRDLKYSTLRSGFNSQEKLLSSLVVKAHTIEKGLTMPNKRIPFGEARAKEVLSGCCAYVERGYDLTESRFVDIVGIMREYRDTLQKNGVSAAALDPFFEKIDAAVPSAEAFSQQYAIKRGDYFANADSGFDAFSASRHSCRNLSGHVSDEALSRALSLSMNAPSTCNRQSHRIHLLQSEEAKKAILSIQGGCRGFGELADQFILITSDLSCWPSGTHRNGPYIDGGAYLMNLLYSLHHENLAACTLNLYLHGAKDRKLHRELGIPENEVPVALIAIGIPPEEFDLARSHRRDASEVITRH